VIFYTELPKHKQHNYVNCPDSGEIELGGSDQESVRSIFLVVGPGAERNENDASSKERIPV